MMKVVRTVVILVMVSMCSSAMAMGADVDFVRDVRPIFQEHCYTCHGPETHKSGLRLDIRSEAFRGGDVFGAAIIPGNADESKLIRFVRGDDEDMEMPPKGEPLSDEKIAVLVNWINAGANWPDGIDLAVAKDRRDHWSLKPIAHPEVPRTEDRQWRRNAIDAFVLARLEKEGLTPAPKADPLTWLRRVYLDLIGLPPSPDQVKAFLEDVHRDEQEGGDGEAAYERVVEALLGSPRYGERWAQHWLDVVRYADTHGFEVNTERPNAWPYRDYVINAFNEDTPYDEFIRQQIAGDALGEDAATGFLVTASVLLPGQIGKDAPSMRLARQDSLDEIVVNISQTFLGMSIGCARCHNHKFDPITAKDYYAMQAFISGVKYGDREIRSAEAQAQRREGERLKRTLRKIEGELARYVPLVNSGVERSVVNARVNTDRFAPVKTRRVRFTIEATNRLEPCIDELEIFNTANINVALASHNATVESSGDTTVADRHELRFINDGEYGNSRSWMSNETGKGWVIVEFPGEHEIDRVVWGRDRQRQYGDRLATAYRIEVSDSSGQWRTVADSSDRAPYMEDDKDPVAFSTAGLTPDELKQVEQLLARKLSLEEKISNVSESQMVFAGVFDTPDEIHLLLRGDPEQPQKEVAPAIPEVFGEVELSGDISEQDRRIALARWIVSETNPLTARVMANRIWQGHFGIGLVSTPNDFGHNGTTPSHPALLDWLATEFVNSGWSVKHMHRLITLSSTYRQAATHNSAAAAKDADVRLLWRYPSRRIEGEAVRDSILAVSGRLNLTMGGRGFDLFDKRGGLSGFNPVEEFKSDGLRRMIYAHKVRRETDAVFGAFDCPDGGQSAPRRRESTTPIQALNLFNSRFVLDASQAFAARIKSDVGKTDSRSQIIRAYQLALNRDPKAAELADALAVIDEYSLATLCRALINSNEFLFLP